MADILSGSTDFQKFSKSSQREIRRRFNKLSKDKQAKVALKLGVSVAGKPTRFEKPQSLVSAGLEAAREPARVSKRGLEQISQFTGQARQARPGQPLTALADIAAKGAAAVAPGFISPEAAVGGAAGKLVGAGAGVVGKAIQRGRPTGPLGTAIKTPSVASSSANQRAFIRLERIKQELMSDAIPEQVNRATEIVGATPRVQQRFLNNIKEFIKNPTVLQQTDSATLLAARDIAGQLQGRGGTFAGISRSLRRKLGRILEQRAPGFQKALERVEDVFKATGEPDKPVSLISAVVAAGRPGTAASLLPRLIPSGAKRVAGAAIGLAGRAAGLPLQRGGTLGAAAGSQLREGQ